MAEPTEAFFKIPRELPKRKEVYPPRDEQAEFFRQALLEGAEIDKPPRLVPGPFFWQFTDVMKSVDDEIKAINPAFTSEYIFPAMYRSSAVQKEIDKTTGMERLQLYRVKEKRMELLAGAAQEVVPIVREQGLRHIDETPFCSQEEDWTNGQKFQGCENACFRMVFAALTDWRPSQAALSEQLIGRYQTSIVEDRVFYDMLKTDVFQEVADKKVTYLETIGADLQFIDTIAQKIKAKRANAKVFCTANVASEKVGIDRAVWHAVTLLSAEDGKMKYHDPSSQKRGPYRTQDSETFAHRWAMTYNRARIIIAE